VSGLGRARARRLHDETAAAAIDDLDERIARLEQRP